MIYSGQIPSYAAEEVPPKNAKEYYDKYLKGQGYRTSYNESVGSLPYEELSSFIQAEIKREFRMWSRPQNSKSIFERQDKKIDLSGEEEKSSGELQKSKKSKAETTTIKKEELPIVHEEKIHQEKKEVPLVDEIAIQLNNDKEYLMTIAMTIMNRIQTQTIVQEETKAKYGPESFEIWKKLPYGLSWGEKKKRLAQKEKETLETLFGSLDKAKMKINREDFILAKNLILHNPVAKAKNVCKQGSIELIEDTIHNPTRPFTIICNSEESQLTGILYKKNESNEISEESLNKIYVSINISDIVEKIKISGKSSWNSKKADWNKEQDGRMTTITPTQQ